MELTLAVIISLLNIVICVSNFVLNRRDKAVKDAKELNIGLINYQLGELKEDVKTILDKISDYDKETKKQIDEALELHIKMYHKGEK